jgi:DNA-directed RNA polymerase specialized sigma24 family protein
MGDPRLEVGACSGSEPEPWISESYSRILTSCVYAGLPPCEADDVAQDIWLWLLRQGSPSPIVSMPWLSAVSRNFILRYRRRSFRRKAREGRPLDAVPEPRAAESLPELEASELLDRVAAAVPEIERRLLALIRRGHSLAEAARLLGIPRGSRAYYHQKLITCGRRELRARTARAVGAALAPPASAR